MRRSITTFFALLMMIAGGAAPPQLRRPAGDRHARARHTGDRVIQATKPGEVSARTQWPVNMTTKVMSTSAKPRLAGRQPSSCGGVLRVMTGLPKVGSKRAFAGGPHVLLSVDPPQLNPPTHNPWSM